MGGWLAPTTRILTVRDFRTVLLVLVVSISHLVNRIFSLNVVASAWSESGHQWNTSHALPFSRLSVPDINNSQPYTYSDTCGKKNHSHGRVLNGRVINQYGLHLTLSNAQQDALSTRLWRLSGFIGDGEGDQAKHEREDALRRRIHYQQTKDVGDQEGEGRQCQAEGARLVKLLLLSSNDDEGIYEFSGENRQRKHHVAVRGGCYIGSLTNQNCLHWTTCTFFHFKWKWTPGLVQHICSAAAVFRSTCAVHLHRCSTKTHGCNKFQLLTICYTFLVPNRFLQCSGLPWRS